MVVIFSSPKDNIPALLNTIISLLKCNNQEHRNLTKEAKSRGCFYKISNLAKEMIDDVVLKIVASILVNKII